MSNDETTSERLFFGFIKLTDRQQLIGVFLIVIGFQIWNNHQNTQEIKTLHKNEMDRAHALNVIIVNENIDLKKELIRSYDSKHDAVQQKLTKVDSIIQYHKK